MKSTHSPIRDICVFSPFHQIVNFSISFDFLQRSLVVAHRTATEEKHFSFHQINWFAANQSIYVKLIIAYTSNTIHSRNVELWRLVDSIIGIFNWSMCVRYSISSFAEHAKVLQRWSSGTSIDGCWVRGDGCTWPANWLRGKWWLSNVYFFIQYLDLFCFKQIIEHMCVVLPFCFAILSKSIDHLVVITQIIHVNV